MKNLLLIVLVFASSAVMAESVVLLDTKIAVGFDPTVASSKFYMDTQTGQGYAKVNVTEYERVTLPIPDTRCDRFGCFPAPGRNPIPRIRTIFQDTIMIENLKLVNKEMIYTSENGEVNCGTLGTSRVLRRPTLYLTGNCKLTSILVYDRLTVAFTAK